MPEPILENRVLERHDTGPSVQNVLLGQGFEGPRCRSGTADMVFVHGLGTGDRLLSGDDGMKVTDLLERQRFHQIREQQAKLLHQRSVSLHDDLLRA